MLLRLAQVYIRWLLISIGVCTIGTVASLSYSVDLAKEFFISFVYHWNGLLIGAFGCGTLQFGLSTYKKVYHNLIFDILEMDNDSQLFVARELNYFFSFWRKQIIAIPVFLSGGMLLYFCGYPLKGFPKLYLWLTSSSMYYVGGLMLSYSIGVIRLFKIFEQLEDKVTLQENTHILELENFNFHQSLLLFGSVVALFFAFKGTITANLTFSPPNPWVETVVSLITYPSNDYHSIRNLLVFPIILFLPITLLTSFYTRFVLRKIFLRSLRRKIEEIENLTNPLLSSLSTLTPDKVVELKNSVFDLKDKILKGGKSLPLVNLKDSPSIIVGLILIVQFIYQNDLTIRKYLHEILGV